jgi:membrane protease YdiL (CAAX protease family)
MKQYPPSFQFVIFIGFFIGFYLLYFLFLIIVFPHISGYTIFTLQSLDSSVPKVLGYRKLTQILYTLVVYLSPALIFARLSAPKPLEYLSMNRAPQFIPAILAILIILVSLPMVDLSGQWNQSWHVSETMRMQEELAGKMTRDLLKMNSFSTLLGNILFFAVMPAVAEEAFFRSVVQRLMIKMMPFKNGAWVAILVTALMFSAIHLQWLSFVPRVILGFLLGVIYYLTGNLWLSILAHTINNGLTVVLMYLFQMHLMHTDPMESGQSNWPAAVASLIVTGLWVWVLQRRSRPAIQ